MNDTNYGEQDFDTEASEQSQNSQNTESSEFDAGKEEARVKARDGIIQSALEKIGYDNGQYSDKLFQEQPEWVRKEIEKRRELDTRETLSADKFDELYKARRDEEKASETLQQIVKDNYLDADAEKALKQEMDKLVKEHKMSHTDALRYASSQYSNDSLKRGIQIGAGGVAPYTTQSQATFAQVSVSQFDSMNPTARQEYMAKSVEQYGEVIFK